MILQLTKPDLENPDELAVGPFIASHFTLELQWLTLAWCFRDE